MIDKQLIIQLIQKSLSSFQFENANDLSSLLFTAYSFCEESCYLHAKCSLLIGWNPCQSIIKYMHSTQSRPQKLLYMIALSHIKYKKISEGLLIVKEFTFTDQSGKDQSLNS